MVFNVMIRRVTLDAFDSADEAAEPKDQRRIW